MSFEMNEHIQERVQSVFIKHCQNASDSPILRDEFIHAGWNQQIFLTYYHFTHVLYFAYMCYREGLGDSIGALLSKEDEQPERYKEKYNVLKEACCKIEVFFKKDVGFEMDGVSCVTFIEEQLPSGVQDVSSTYQTFVLLLELYVGKQLKNLDDIQYLFGDYYNKCSRNYGESRPTISKESFLNAGWTLQIYQDYYNVMSHLYYSLMLRQNNWAPVEDSDFEKPTQYLLSSNSSTSKMLADAFENLCGFVKNIFMFS